MATNPAAPARAEPGIHGLFFVTDLLESLIVVDKRSAASHAAQDPYPLANGRVCAGHIAGRHALFSEGISDVHGDEGLVG